MSSDWFRWLWEIPIRIVCPVLPSGALFWKGNGLNKAFMLLGLVMPLFLLSPAYADPHKGSSDKSSEAFNDITFPFCSGKQKDQDHAKKLCQDLLTPTSCPVLHEHLAYQNCAKELREDLYLIPALAINSDPRYRLRLQIQAADELVERAERQLKVILPFQYQLQKGQMLASNEMPKSSELDRIHELETVIHDINELSPKLYGLQQTLQEKMAALQQQIAAFEQPKKVENEEVSNEPAPIDLNTQVPQVLKTLKRLFEQELHQMQSLREERKELLPKLEGKVPPVQWISRNWPSSTELNELGNIPSLFWHQLQGIWESVQAFEKTGVQFAQTWSEKLTKETSQQETSKQHWFIIGIATLIWLALLIGVSAWATRFFKTSAPAEKRGWFYNLVVGFRLWQNNILSLIAITGVFLLLLIWLTQPNSSPIFALMVLLTFLGGKLLISLSGWLISAPEFKSRDLHILSLQLRWTIIVLGLVAVITALVHMPAEGAMLFTLEKAKGSVNFLSFLNVIGILFLVLWFFTIRAFIRVRQFVLNWKQQRWTILLGLLTVILALVHFWFWFFHGSFGLELVNLKPAGKEVTLPLNLNARDLIDTLFMVILLLTVPALIRVRQLMRDLTSKSTEGYWPLAINLITYLMGIILAVSIVGIIGYINISWTLAKYLSAFWLVLSFWLITHKFLNDSMTRWKNVVLERSRYGSLWAENIIPIVHNLLKLLLFGLAVIAFLLLTGWYSDPDFNEAVKNVFSLPLLTFDSGNQITVSHALKAILFIWAVFWLGGWFRRVSYQWIFLPISDKGIRHSLSILIHYLVVLIGLFIVLKVIGIDPTALTVFAGAVGVGIGFGLQNIADNFISGILLLIERPLRVGDFVEIGTDVMYTGTVKQIGIRSLTLETEDKKQVVVPNSDIISSPFANRAGSRTTDDSTVAHLIVNIGISYDSDPHLADKIIRGVLEEDSGILSEPPFEVYLSELTDFKMNFRIDYYLDTDIANPLKVKSKVLFNILVRLKEAGIKIPSPTFAKL